MVTREQIISTLVTPLLAVLLLVTLAADSAAQDGYDTYGYNYVERKFTGLYEDADRDSGNNTGDGTQLQMEWSDGLDLGQLHLSTLGAWVTNFQQGTYPDSDGVVHRWSYSVKLVYTGPGSPVEEYFTKEEETYLDAGGSPTPQFRPPVLPRPGP